MDTLRSLRRAYTRSFLIRVKKSDIDFLIVILEIKAVYTTSVSIKFIAKKTLKYPSKIMT